LPLGDTAWPFWITVMPTKLYNMYVLLCIPPSCIELTVERRDRLQYHLNVMGPFWDERRKLVDNDLKDIHLPDRFADHGIVR